MTIKIDHFTILEKGAGDSIRLIQTDTAGTLTDIVVVNRELLQDALNVLVAGERGVEYMKTGAAAPGETIPFALSLESELPPDRLRADDFLNQKNSEGGRQENPVDL